MTEPAPTSSCPRCGTPAPKRPGRRPTCPRCRAALRVEQVLADRTGAVHPALAPLAAALSAKRPKTVLIWLSRPHVRELLTALANGRLPLTHDALTSHDRPTDRRPIPTPRTHRLRRPAAHRQDPGRHRTVAAPPARRAGRPPARTTPTPLRVLAPTPPPASHRSDPAATGHRQALRHPAIHPSPGVPDLAASTRYHPGRPHPGRTRHLVRQRPRPPTAPRPRLSHLGHHQRPPTPRPGRHTTDVQTRRRHHPATPPGPPTPAHHRRPRRHRHPHRRLPAAALRPTTQPHSAPHHRPRHRTRRRTTHPPRRPTRPRPRALRRTPAPARRRRPCCSPAGSPDNPSPTRLCTSGFGTSASHSSKPASPRYANSSYRPPPPSSPRPSASTRPPPPARSPTPAGPGASTPQAITPRHPDSGSLREPATVEYAPLPVAHIGGRAGRVTQAAVSFPAKMAESRSTWRASPSKVWRSPPAGASARFSVGDWSAA